LIDLLIPPGKKTQSDDIGLVAIKTTINKNDMGKPFIKLTSIDKFK